MAAEKLLADANELMLDDQYDKALKILSEAVDLCNNEQNANVLIQIYVRRSECYVKLKKFKEALDDAQLAVDTNGADLRGYLKKGIAEYHLGQYESSLKSLEQGLAIADSESSVKVDILNEWIAKCKLKLPPPKPAQTEVTADDSSTAVEAAKPNIQPTIKYEWYQTESQVTVSILVKNVNPEEVSVTSTNEQLSVVSKTNESLKFNFALANPVASSQTQVKYLATKIEIKLKKQEVIQWKTLELDPKAIAAKAEAPKPQYPTSSKKPKNWDRIAADVEAEEKNEQLEGDSALNKLFQQVYQNGTEETRRAMNKSFMESGGTVLSTNWKDVGSKKLDVKPPDGMEWKTWSS